MKELEFTSNSAQKYNQLVNGVKKEVDSFLNSLRNEKICETNLEVLFKSSNDVFYFKECNKIYIVLSKVKGGYMILDFLTESEFKLSERH